MTTVQAPRNPTHFQHLMFNEEVIHPIIDGKSYPLSGTILSRDSLESLKCFWLLDPLLLLRYVETEMCFQSIAHFAFKPFRISCRIMAIEFPRHSNKTVVHIREAQHISIRFPRTWPRSFFHIKSQNESYDKCTMNRQYLALCQNQDCKIGTY